MLYSHQKDFCYTHSCDGASVQVVDTSGGVATDDGCKCWAKEVRDMDAGPSHSRSGVCVHLLLGLFFSSSSMVIGTRILERLIL
jgi:hypothetical protein